MARSQPSLVLRSGGRAVKRVALSHPLALPSPECSRPIAGLLLGRASAGAMEVTSTIPVRHSMTGQSIDLQHDAMNKMIELMGEVDSTQALVGWYLVGGDSAAAGEGKGAEAASGGDREPLVNEASALLHDFFSCETRAQAGGATFWGLPPVRARCPVPMKSGTTLAAAGALQRLPHALRRCHEIPPPTHFPSQPLMPWSTAPCTLRWTRL